MSEEEKAQLSGKPTFKLEGFLRRSGKYKPMVPYVPLSRFQEEQHIVETIEGSSDEDVEMLTEEQKPMAQEEPHYPTPPPTSPNKMEE